MKLLRLYNNLKKDDPIIVYEKFGKGFNSPVLEVYRGRAILCDSRYFDYEVLETKHSEKGLKIYIRYK